jgi:hypothetical protein
MRARLLTAALLLALGFAGIARGEVIPEPGGNLLVTFDGGIAPKTLPRKHLAPVTVSIDTTFKTDDGSDPPPQLRTVSIGINRGGRIDDRGLPTCHVRKIQPATIAAARRICGGAIVGNGHVGVRVELPNQQPFNFSGPMLVFNAERSGGKRRILAQVYGSRPPSAFVLTFRILKRGGTFGNVIETTLPKQARKWAYVTHFDMRLRRVYTYHGQQHSYVSASCPAPPGFTAAIYPFAEPKFGFAGGRSVTATVSRTCHVG